MTQTKEKILLRILSIALGTLLTVSNTLSAPSQTDPLAGTTVKFEVASIKESKSFDIRHVLIRIMNRSNDGRFYGTNVTAKLLIKLAYDVQDSQIVGGPDWINSERFNIEAKADSTTDAELKRLSPRRAKLVKERMLQELLTDRFKLKLRHETKQLPIYALEVTKTGPKLQEAKDIAPGAPGFTRGVRMLSNAGEVQLDFKDLPISSFVKTLHGSVGRIVIDRTELTGRYNFKLHWASESGRVMPGGSGVPATGLAPAPAPSGPSIFTALQEQLGLKLKAEKASVEILVIDHIDKPSAN